MVIKLSPRVIELALALVIVSVGIVSLAASVSFAAKVCYGN